MLRREFVKRLGLGLAAGWTLNHLPWPHLAEASAPHLRLALLADAHLKNGNPALPEAQALARAVAEIRAMKPAPDLVLFAGDLAHDGDPQALALGQEILSDLPAPLLMVRGEGDGPVDGVAWNRLFGEARYTHTVRGATIIALDTTMQHTGHGPTFTLGEAQYHWLTRELPRLDPAAPLIILSHSPLVPIFQPWQQWTADADRLAPLLPRFRRVLFLHGHGHHSVIRGQGSGVRNKWSAAISHWPAANHFTKMISTALFTSQNPEPRTQNLPLPATAWPLPSPFEGTPSSLMPGLAPHGCGWGTIAIHPDSWEFHPRLWQA